MKPAKLPLYKKFLKLFGNSREVEIASEFISYEVSKYRKSIIAGGILVFISAVMLLPQPFFIGFILDRIIPEKNVSGLIITLVLLFLIQFCSSVISYKEQLVFFKVNSRIIIDIRKKLLKKISQLPLCVIKKYSTGYLMSRIQDDPPRLAGIFGEQMIYLLKQLMIFAVSITSIFLINYKLAAISMLALPFFMFTVSYFSKKIKTLSSAAFEETSKTSKSLAENIDMAPMGKIFNRERFILIRYVKVIHRTYLLFLSLKRTESMNEVVFGFIGSLLPLTVICFGGFQIINGDFTIGMLVTFLSLLNNVVGPASTLIGFNTEIQKIVVALERVGEILDFPEERSVNFSSPHNVDSIELRHLSFSYDETDTILSDINLKAQKGMKIGIVGLSGSGKTSLANILSGLYDYSGEILINGSAISTCEKQVLRKNVSVVPQDPVMFNDSIYNNVAFGKYGTTLSEVNDALKKAHVLSFVQGLEEKEQTPVGEKGNRLSVGQKQRLAIARALIKNSDILLLDEATSNVDNISEVEIMKAVNEIAIDRIVFIIAHKLETVRNCDEIIVLDTGRIVERGTHNELMGRNGYYKAMKDKGKGFEFTA